MANCNHISVIIKTMLAQSSKALESQIENLRNIHQRANNALIMAKQFLNRLTALAPRVRNIEDFNKILLAYDEIDSSIDTEINLLRKMTSFLIERSYKIEDDDLPINERNSFFTKEVPSYGTFTEDTEPLFILKIKLTKELSKIRLELQKIRDDLPTQIKIISDRLAENIPPSHTPSRMPNY